MMLDKTIAAIKAGLEAYRSVQYSEKFNKWISASGESVSGAQVDEDTVFNISTVYSCVNLVSKTVGSLPLKLYKKEGESRQIADTHYLYDILHNRPNPYMLPSSFKETLQAHVLTWGDGYAEIERDVMGRPLHLWPVHASRVTPRLVNGEMVYDIYVTGGEVYRLPASKIFHLPGLSFNGISGITPIQKSRETFGRALAAQEYGSRYFSGDATPNGVAVHPGVMGDKPYERLQKSLKEGRKGLKGQHRIMLLEEGVQYTKVGLSPEDSQLLDTEKFSGNQICGMYGVPPHMVGLLDHATFSNIEHQNISFMTAGIYPWTKKWEEAVNLRLVMPAERNTFYAEFISDGYLRGDIAARTAYYASALQNGYMSVNDVRRKENMNPVPGGDKYFRQLNMAPIDAPIPVGGKPNENKQTQA